MPSPVITAPEQLTGPYRSVNYRDEIVFGVAGLLGLNVVDIAGDLARNLAALANTWLRKGWEYNQWEEFRITEERPFRQVLAPELAYPAGTEVYDLETEGYWKAMDAIAPGETPSDAPDKWEALTVLDRFVARDQYLAQRIGQVLNVYPSNPRLMSPRQRRRYALPFRRSQMGIDVTTGLKTVWLDYRPEQPVFTSVEHDPAKTYRAGALVYSPGEPGDPETGDCFRALQQTAVNDQLTAPQKWYQQLFPYKLAEYVKYGIASELTDTRGSRADYAAAAAEQLEREFDLEAEQGVEGPVWTLGRRSDCQPSGYSYVTLPATLIVPA